MFELEVIVDAHPGPSFNGLSRCHASGTDSYP
jgi:hypothetical protein